MQLEERELLVELIKEVRRIADALENLRVEIDDYDEFPEIQ